MEYTQAEKDALAFIQRTDFKNISKNEVVSIVSRLADMRPDVAKEVIAQFPEMGKLLASTANEYRCELEKIIGSDDESLKQVFDVLDKGLDISKDRRVEYNKVATQILRDLSKGLDNPNISEEERNKIREQELDVLRMVDKKDSEINNQEKDIISAADKKDSEKRAFNWKVLGIASSVAVVVVGAGIAALGGKIDLNLPKKS